MGMPPEEEAALMAAASDGADSTEPAHNADKPMVKSSEDRPVSRREAVEKLHNEAKPEIAPKPAPAGEAVAAVVLNVDDIEPNPFQPRRDFNPQEIASLAHSILSHQQIQPVLVRIVDGRYQLISGERRLRATKHAGLKTIRAEVREADDRLVSELAIIENLMRKDLNAIEKAMSFRRYLDEHNCTQEELASRLGLDRSTIANTMRLLELPEPIKEMVQKGEMTGGHAKPLLALGSEKHQMELARQVILEGWSVRKVESVVRETLYSDEETEHDLLNIPSPSRRPKKEPQVLHLEQRIRAALGTKTEIQRTSRGRGKIVVHYNNVEEFERLFAMFTGSETDRVAA